MCGVVLRNILEHGLKVQVFDRCIDVFGNASLALFLAMALMSLQLWLLADLAGPLVIILIVQTLFLALYLYFVTFRVMGKNLRCCGTLCRPMWCQLRCDTYSNCQYSSGNQYLWTIP